MHDLNLVLKFQLAGENHYQIRGASRIKVDGRGLMFYDVQSGAAEKIDVAQLQSFSLVSTETPSSFSPLPN